MILKWGRLPAFLRQPDPALRAFLIYGEDRGAAREAADRIAAAFCPDLADPFRVADLAAQTIADDPVRLGDEAAALSMTGGRRVVRVRGAGDNIGEIFAEFLAAPVGEAVVIVEAGILSARSPLRTAFEKSDLAAAVACYVADPDEAARLVAAGLKAMDVAIDDDALAVVVDRLGPDRAGSKREIEKLGLYAGPGGRIDEAAAEACVADAGEAEMGALVDSALDGDLGGMEEAWRRLAGEGAQAASIVRALSSHLMRVMTVQGRMRAGQGAEAAAAGLRPPVFFKRRDAFMRHVRLWSGERLRTGLDRLIEAEIRCKETGEPASLLAHRAAIELATEARRARAR